MPNLYWNAIVRFAPITNPIATMAIDMIRNIRSTIASVARHLDGKLAPGTGAASASSGAILE